MLGRVYLQRLRKDRPGTVSGTAACISFHQSCSLWLVIFLHLILNLSMMYSNIEPAAGETAVLVVNRLANVFELALAAWVVFRGAPARAR